MVDKVHTMQIMMFHTTMHPYMKQNTVICLISARNLVKILVKIFIITTFQHSKGFWMSKDTHLLVLCGFAGEETGLAVLKRSSGISDDAPVWSPVWSLVVPHRTIRESSQVLRKCSISVD